MNDVKDWIVAIVSHWQYWASGGGLGGLVVILTNLVERLRNKAMSNTAYVLIFVVCFLVGASFMAWRSEHHALLDEVAKREKLELERPYILIEPVPANKIKAISMRDPTNPVRPLEAYGSDWLTMVTSTNEIFYYGYRIATGKLPAENVTHYQKITTIGDNPERNIPASVSQVKGEILFPDQPQVWGFEVPRGTFFTNEPNEKRRLRIELVVTYTGQPTDKNTYFYKIVLISGRFRDMAQVNRLIGTTSIDSTEQGVLTSDILNKLVK